MSPAERCDFVGVKLKKVHELVGKEWSFIIWLNAAYYTTKVPVTNTINTQSSIFIDLLII